MNKPEEELSFEERLRWQILIVRLRIDANEPEESLQMFNNELWATLDFYTQRTHLEGDKAFDAWIIALQDNWISEVLASDNFNGEILANHYPE